MGSGLGYLRGCKEVLYWGDEDQYVDTGKRTVISDDGIKLSFMNSKHSYKKSTWWSDTLVG